MVWTVVRWVVAILLITALFAVFYSVGPKRQTPHWQWLSPGALLGTLVWVAATLAFSWLY